jgi:hypothetical protein
MEARALRGQPDEDRHGAVCLRAGLGEEAVGDLALHHHAPELERREPVEALGDERGGDVVREVRDELARRRLERLVVEAERVGEVERHVGARPERRAQLGLETAIELDRVHMGDAVCEVASEHAETGPDLEHDVVRLEPGQPADHAEDVLVDEEVLAELLLR